MEIALLLENMDQIRRIQTNTEILNLVYIAAVLTV